MKRIRKRVNWLNFAFSMIALVVVCSLCIDTKAATKLTLSDELASYFSATYDSTNGVPMSDGMSITISAKANKNYGGIKGSSSGCSAPKGYSRATTLRLKALDDCKVSYTVTFGETVECSHGNGDVVLKGTEIAFTVESPTDAADSTASVSVTLTVTKQDHPAPEGCATYYVKETPATTYYYLDEAVEAAQGTTEQIVVLKTSGNVYAKSDENEVEIPAGVTLLLPREPGELDIGSSTVENKSDTADITLENANFSAWAWDSRWKIEPSRNRYLMLTIPSGTTVKNNGSIILGGSVAANIAYFNGGTLAQEEASNHRHSDLTVNGTLELGNNSVLSAIGFVLGTGTVKTTGAGAKIYQPFVVNDYRGANYIAGAAGALHDLGKSYSPGTKSGETAVSPFVRYSLVNIRAQLIMDGGNYMYGYCNMWASDKHNMTVGMIIGGSEDAALIKLPSTATLTATYNPNVKITHTDPDDNTNWGYDYVGKTTMTISGGATMGSMSLSVPFGNQMVAISMSGVTFPLPYNYDITLIDGDYLIPQSMMLLPGAKLTVGTEATLDIGDGTNAIRFMVMDGLYDHTLCGDSKNVTVTYSVQNDYNYPTSAELMAARDTPYSGTACLIVDGGILNVNSGVSFGGLVQTNGSGTLNFKSGAINTCTTQVGLTGAGGTYKWAGATVRTLDAKVKLGDNRDVKMTAGTTYKGAADTDNAITSYTYTLYTTTSGTNSAKEESVNIPVSGMWYDYTLTIKEDGKDDVVYYHLNNKLYTADGEVTSHTITEGSKAEITSGSGVTLTTDGATLSFSDVALTKDTVVTVSVVCEHKGAVKTEEIPATCEDAGIKAYWFCEACNKYFSDAECAIEIENIDTWVNTEGENGGLIPAEGHDYRDPTFNWADDNSCTATFTCANGGEELSVKCTVIVEQTVDTETLEVTETVTATVTVGDKNYSESKENSFTAVAKVDWTADGKDDTYYEELQTAVDAAVHAGDTVVVLSNLTMNEAITVAENQNITLDLNGHSVTAPQFISIPSGATVDITSLSGANGTLTGTLESDAGTDDGSKAITDAPGVINNSGTLSVSNVNINQNTATPRAGIFNAGSGRIIAIDNVTIDLTNDTSVDCSYGIANLGAITTIGSTVDKPVVIRGANYGIRSDGKSSTIHTVGEVDIDAAAGAIWMIVGSGSDNGGITQIGIDGGTTELTGGRGIYAGRKPVTTIGTSGSRILIDATTHGIYSYGGGGKIGTIGTSGSYVEINSEETGIYVYYSGSVKTIGASGGQVKVNAGTNGIYLYRGSSVTTIGEVLGENVDADATVEIASLAGIYVKAYQNTTTNIAEIGSVKITATGSNSYGICVYGSSQENTYATITNIGMKGCDTFIEGAYAGIYLNLGGTISSIGGSGFVEVRGPRTIFAPSDSYGTITGIYDGTVVIGTGASTQYAVKTDVVTVETFYGGSFYHASGRASAIRNPDDQTYRDGYTLSAEGKTIPVKLSDGTIKNCYYITAKTPTAGTVTGGGSLGVEGIEDIEKEYASLADAIAAYESMSAADKKNSYVVLYADTTEAANITVSEDLYLDLNGCTVTLGGSILNLGSHKLYGMDSRTNAYSDKDAGAIIGTISGDVAPVTQPTGRGANGGKTYVTVVTTDDNEVVSTSFHRIAVHVTGIQLAVTTEETPKGYLSFRGTFRGDAQAAGKLTDVGFMFDDGTKTWYSSHASGEEKAGSIEDIQADQSHFYYTKQLSKINDIAQAAALMQFGSENCEGKSVDVSDLHGKLQEQINSAEWTEAQNAAVNKFFNGETVN